jgi:hypothetical protein
MSIRSPVGPYISDARPSFPFPTPILTPDQLHNRGIMVSTRTPPTSTSTETEPSRCSQCSSQATTLTPSVPPSIPLTANRQGKRPVSDITPSFPQSLITEKGPKFNLAESAVEFTVASDPRNGGSVTLLVVASAKQGYQTRVRTLKAGTVLVVPGGTECTATGSFKRVLDEKSGKWS